MIRPEEILIQRIEKARGKDGGEASREKALAMKDLETNPRVIAKGRGEVARAILKIAEECGIPVYDDPDLFEALCTLDVGERIPEELYGVLAQIISFVYEANRDFGHEQERGW
jgi:flagellar biosynthesis protein